MPKRRQIGKKSKETSDLGTPELSLRHAVKVEPVGPLMGAVRLRVLDGCELDRLLSGELIMPDQHNAGLKLGWDIGRAGGKKSCFSNFEGGLSKGGTVGGRVMFAVSRIASAIHQVQRKTNRKTARLVFTVASDEARVTSRAELLHLISGLKILSSYYAARTSVPLSLV
jgi:hypothetical protein